MTSPSSPPATPSTGTGSADRTDAPRGTVLAALTRQVRRYLSTEASSAGLLLLATVAALAWANSPWSASYTAFWDTEFSLRLGEAALTLDLKHWVNDGLMVFFFFVVGLEVKRELSMGELTDRRRAAIPLAAAIAGLAIPAAVFLAFNPTGEAAAAWGVVISTDTAFLLGVLVLVGPACPAALRVFLLTLAVADDVGALAIIAVFYTEDLALGPLALAVAGLGLMLVMRYLLGIWRGPGYLVVGVVVWVATYASGVHPTLAGVVIALFAPAFPARRDDVAEVERRTRAFRQSPSPEFARAARLSIDRSVSGAERLQMLYQPWSSYVIVPVFALANAGVVLTADTLVAAATSALTLGVIAGLVVGKLLGVLAGTYGAFALRLGRLAPGLRFGQLAGGAALSGIGFTISLFIVDVALTDPVLADQARVGVLAASVIAAALGWVLFRLADRFQPGGEVRPSILDLPVDAERDHVRGPVDAPLTLVEYGDFECPFCGRATGVVSELRERLGDQLRYVFRHIPLVDVHPRAELAAEAAEAAGAQGRFWEMHDRLFAHQDQLSPADLLDHAGVLGLDLPRFAADLAERRHEDRVRDDAASAEASGVTGTPTFFVDGRRHTGPYDADTLAARLLATAPSEVPDDPRAPTRGAAASPGQPLLGPARTVPTPGTAAGDPLAALIATELEETPDTDGAFPRLSGTELAVLERRGRRHDARSGDVLFREGDPGCDLHVVLAGTVAILENAGRDDQRVVAVMGPGRFLGELNLLSDTASVYLRAVVTTPGEVLTVPSDALPLAFADDPALRRTIERALLRRRARLLRLAADLTADDPAEGS